MTHYSLTLRLFKPFLGNVLLEHGGPPHVLLYARQVKRINLYEDQGLKIFKVLSFGSFLENLRHG